MDSNHSSSQAGALGPQRMPAAILLLWDTLFAVVAVAYGGSLPYVDIFWWLSRLTQLALVILLFVGRKNVGILIPLALYALLAAVDLFAGFSIGSLLHTAIWAVLCLIAMAAVIPELGPRKPLLEVLSYLPAGLSLAMGAFQLISDLASGWFTPAHVLYDMNYVLWALGLLFLAKALVEPSPEGDALPAQADGSVYRTYSQPAPSPQSAPAPSVAAQRTAPGVLLVRFSIDRLNELRGSYGFQSGMLIGRAVPASLLEGMVISDGDSAATLAGREYVCIVSIAASDSSILKERIEPLILASEEIAENGAYPLTQLVDSTSEPLVMDGVVRNGTIEGPGGWCANGLASAWKVMAARQQSSSSAGGDQAEAVSEHGAVQSQEPCQEAVDNVSTEQAEEVQEEVQDAAQTPDEADKPVDCEHEWLPVNGEWREKCVRCGIEEPAKLRERTGGILFPMACVPDSDLEIILTALKLKSMIRSVLDEPQNEFQKLGNELRHDREYLLDQEEWKSVFLALSTYGSTSPVSCPPIYATLLEPTRQQRVKDFLFDAWMSLI